MADVIPTRTDITLYTETVALGIGVFKLQFRWNGREEFWYFNILTVADDQIFMGLKLVADSELIDRFADARKPDGFMVIADMTGAGNDPSRDSLGVDSLLAFASQSGAV